MSSATPRWRRMVMGMAAMLFSAALWAQPQPWKSIETAAIDDPRAALQAAQAAFERARSDGDADAQFWASLAQARVLISLEETERRQTALAQAHALLERVRGNAAQAQLWLAIVQALSDVRESPNRGMLARLEALRQQARAGAQRSAV